MHVTELIAKRSGLEILFTRDQHAAVLLGESGDCFASTIWELLLAYMADRSFVNQRRIAFGVKPLGGRFF